MLHDDIVKQCRVLIRPICYLVPAVSCRQRRQYLRGNARIIIGGKAMRDGIVQGFYKISFRNAGLFYKRYTTAQWWRREVSRESCTAKLVTARTCGGPCGHLGIGRV